VLVATTSKAYDMLIASGIQMLKQNWPVWTYGEIVKRASHEFKNVYILDFVR